MTPETLRDIWYRALTSEIGFEITIADNDMKVWQNKLYEARKALADPELDKLMMILPSGGGAIWLVKKTVEIDE